MTSTNQLRGCTKVRSWNGWKSKTKSLLSAVVFRSARCSLVWDSRSLSTMQSEVERAAATVAQADALLITAGAGIGVDSGLPDFRGPQGFWRAYPPIKELGLSFPEVSTPHWFDQDPTFAWGFFGHRYHLYKKTNPHDGFHILLDWANSKKDGYFVFTSNVDGHFQKAGFAYDRIAECHGSIHFMQNTRPRTCEIWPVPDDFQIEIEKQTMRAREPLPTGPPDQSPTKQRAARPNILMFDDAYWISDRSDEQLERFQYFMRDLQRKKSRFAIVEIGAGLAVPSVRLTGERLLHKDGLSTLIRINPNEPGVPNKRHISLQLCALDALKKIAAVLGSSN